MRTRIGQLIILLIALTAASASAAEYHVKQDGSGDFAVIQEAIDVAQDSDTIVVHPGTYYENIRFEGKNITLRSLDPEDEQIVASTVIDGGQNGSVVAFAGTEDETCQLSGFTITNGESHFGSGVSGGTYPGTCAGISNCTISANSGYYGYGGGLYWCNGTISNCTISDNSAWAGGGGLNGCGGMIINCTISGNEGTYFGGGLYDCNGPISDCTINDNSAGWGGGLYDCDGTITNCTISGNSAEGGGGLCACGGTITNCTISENSAEDGGGLDACDGQIISCTISGNSAYNGGGLHYCNWVISESTISDNSAQNGGGFHSCYGSILNCNINGNSAQNGGGFCSCDGVISRCMVSGNSAVNGGGLFECESRVRNCTVASNDAEYGGGLCDCDGKISNCIVWGNQALQEGNQLYRCGSAVISYCCVQGWTGGGDANISDAPLFVAGPLGNYYLSHTAAGQAADSPCIDAGSDTAERFGLDKFTTRTDSVPDAGTVDMGYHYPLTVEQNPQIDCWLNESEFARGDVLQGFIRVENRGAEVVVDVYAAIVMRDGSVISLTQNGFTIGIFPWYSDLALPSGLSVGPEVVFDLLVPSAAVPGNYTYLTAICRADGDSFDILSIDYCPFMITESPGSDYFVHAELGDDTNDGSEDHPWQTITHALSSIEGTELHPLTIHVAPATYSTLTNGERFPLNMKSWVSLIGEDRETTILDAERNAPHVVVINEVSGASIQCLTLMHGYSCRPNLDDGAGIYCYRSSPLIHNNTITENSGSGGGGIYCENGAPSIQDNVITENSASGGGGIYCEGGAPLIQENTISDNRSGWGGGGIAFLESSPQIEANTISNNRAAMGAGVFSEYSSLTLVGNSITGNVCDYDGGGVFCQEGSLIIDGNTISENIAIGDSGGAVCCDHGSLTILNSTIEGNSAADVYDGGGIYCYRCAAIVFNCLIVGNEAGRYGGAICCDNTIVENCTIVRNVAKYGGGMFGDSIIRNCIFFDNTTTVTTGHDDLWGGSATYCCIEKRASGEGNIHADPMFACGPLGDYYLYSISAGQFANSPCIDAGSQSAEDAGLSDRTTRTDGVTDTGTVDMGFHYPVP